MREHGRQWWTRGASAARALIVRLHSTAGRSAGRLLGLCGTLEVEI